MLSLGSELNKKAHPQSKISRHTEPKPSIPWAQCLARAHYRALSLFPRHNLRPPAAFTLALTILTEACVVQTRQLDTRRQRAGCGAVVWAHMCVQNPITPPVPFAFAIAFVLHREGGKEGSGPGGSAC